jgi:hypothetical protein
MTRNIGNAERILRALVGVALILGFFVNTDGQYSWLYLLGIIPLGTAIVGWCPPYALLGINTCKSGK